MMQFINSMESVSLIELDEVALQNRIDHKYVLNKEQLEILIPTILTHYKVLKINGHNAFTYLNNYFDTKQLRFYFDHHNGFSKRIKVRSRKYLETDTSFFEIKQKENVDRTAKFRIPVDKIVKKIDSEKKETIQSFLPRELKKIKLILKNNFTRITFVNHEKTERMTLDFDIQFSNKKKSKSFTNFYVLEIKQSKSNKRSIITEILKKNNIREQSFSKYIFGIISLKKNIKKNNFLPVIKKINNL
ncbi:polyphosphate polymerase domain-containing protein [Flavobacterium sp.]|uniref:polyphosphate polymerase domain-containing protein n=1 Tax=Flavobacterium sp. TaxID=239 RepID=UPI003526DE32